MISKKIIYIIPGYKHKPENKAYKTLVRLLKKEEYIPVPVNIPWQKTTFAENTNFFLKQFKKRKNKNKYILGFSYGAIIAFAASTKVRVNGLILCSLSPYFKEDDTRGEFSCSTLAKKVKAKQILMLYGAKEEKPLIKRVKSAYRLIPRKNKYLIPIEKTEHNIGNRRYLYTIHQVAREII